MSLLQLTWFWTLYYIACRNYRDGNANLNTLCNFFVQTKTFFDQIETKDHKTLFDKSGTKDH